MKRPPLVLFWLAAAATAQEPAGEAPAPVPAPPSVEAAPAPAAPPPLAPPLRKFDRDKDGRLNDGERKLARQAHNRGGREAAPNAGNWRDMLERQEVDFTRRRKEEFDTSKDGQLDREERRALLAVWKRIGARYKTIHAEIVAKYDQTDDGELNDRERREAAGETARLRKEAEEQLMQEWRAERAAAAAGPAPPPAPPPAQPAPEAPPPKKE